MNLGLGLPNTLTGVQTPLLLEWARLADAGPFSSLGVFDRLQYDSYDPLLSLAAASAVTSRIRLATLIVIGPLRNTGVLAKMAQTLHALSQGRFTLGLSVGARREDYEAAAVPYHRRGRLLNEQLEDLLLHLEDESLGPRVGETGRPELLIGGSSDISLARVARFADGYVHGGGPPRLFARLADGVRAAWEDAGRPGRPQIWGMGYYALGDAAVEAAGADYLRHYYSFTGPFAERIAQGLLTTPQAIHQFRRGYAEAGCDELVLFPTFPALDQVERLADIIG